MRHAPIILAIAAMIVPGATLARDRLPSVRVAHDDLDLTSEAGRARFDRRIAGAVERVCPVADNRDVARLLISRRCITETHAKLRPVVASVVARRVAGSMRARPEELSAR